MAIMVTIDSPGATREFYEKTARDMGTANVAPLLAAFSGRQARLRAAIGLSPCGSHPRRSMPSGKRSSCQPSRKAVSCPAG